MAIAVAREGDKIVHTDGTVSEIICTAARDVLVQGKPIATEGDSCAEHGTLITPSIKNVYAGKFNKLIAVVGDLVKCTPSGGVIILDSEEAEGRSVFAGGD